MKEVKTILIGTSKFAEQIFAKLLEVQLPTIRVVGVITAQDKPVGRKQMLTPSPVKKWAIKNNLPVLQPRKIRDLKSIQKIKKLKPNLILLCAYGQIIPKKIIDLPKYGILNVHPSLLPKYRGASPIQTTILNGDRKTGITIISIDEKMDHRDIISNFQFPISNKPTYEKLSKELSSAGASLLIKILTDWINKKIKAKQQDHSKATFCKIIKKQDGKINWNNSAIQIERKIRAFHKWPNAYTFWNNKGLKILDAKPLKIKAGYKAGKVFLDENKNMCVQTNDQALVLKQVQLEGKKPMLGRDFLNGHQEIINMTLR